jgi:hypothetical protein
MQIWRAGSGAAHRRGHGRGRARPARPPRGGGGAGAAPPACAAARRAARRGSTQRGAWRGGALEGGLAPSLTEHIMRAAGRGRPLGQRVGGELRWARHGGEGRFLWGGPRGAAPAVPRPGGRALRRAGRGAAQADGSGRCEPVLLRRPGRRLWRRVWRRRLRRAEAAAPLSTERSGRKGKSRQPLGAAHRGGVRDPECPGPRRAAPAADQEGRCRRAAPGAPRRAVAAGPCPCVSRGPRARRGRPGASNSGASRALVPRPAAAGRQGGEPPPAARQGSAMTSWGLKNAPRALE